MNRIDALKELAAKVKAGTGRATFPSDQHDIERVILETHETISALIAIIIAQAQAGEDG